MTLREFFRIYLEEDVGYLELVFNVFTFFKNIQKEDALIASERTKTFITNLHSKYTKGLSSIKIKKYLEIYLSESIISKRIAE